MSIKTKVLATAAALTVAGGLSTAATLPASASTTQCGSACVQIFNKVFGPGFVESVFLGIPLAGVPDDRAPRQQLRPHGRLHQPPRPPGARV